jgi:hypothetical protein
MKIVVILALHILFFSACRSRQDISDNSLKDTPDVDREVELLRESFIKASPLAIGDQAIGRTWNCSSKEAAEGRNNRSEETLKLKHSGGNHFTNTGTARTKDYIIDPDTSEFHAEYTSPANDVYWDYVRISCEPQICKIFTEWTTTKPVLEKYNKVAFRSVSKGGSLYAIAYSQCLTFPSVPR